MTYFRVIDVFRKLMKWEGCVKWKHVNVMAAMWDQNVTYFPRGPLNVCSQGAISLSENELREKKFK